MGITTTRYPGQIILDNELSNDEYDFYMRWVRTRKVIRNDLTNGCYSCSEDLPEDLFIVLKNGITFMPYILPDGLPSMWCQLIIGADKKTIIRNVESNFYDVYFFSKWVAYIAKHFFNSKPMAKRLYPEEFGFLKENQMNGEIYAECEDGVHVSKIEVVNSRVYLSKILTTHGIDLSGGYDWGVAEEIVYNLSDREQKILDKLWLKRVIAPSNLLTKVIKL